MVSVSIPHSAYRYLGVLRNPRSERAASWRRVMGKSCLPLRSPYAYGAVLPGVGEAMVYDLALEQMTDEQVERLITELAETFGLQRIDVARVLKNDGCPVIADDVIVSVIGLN